MSHSPHVTPRYLAQANLRRNQGRSLLLIFLSLCLSALLFASALLAIGLRRGLHNLGDRMGADIMVVPEGYSAEMEAILLQGKPSNFYLKAEALEKVARQPGVERLSPQIYIATLKASCCSYPLQIIGIDPETDFIVRSWLHSGSAHELGDGELLIGAHVNAELGQQLSFFNEKVRVKGQLEYTGMGFDASVFVNLNTARALARAAERQAPQPLAEDQSLISTIMLRCKPGIDPAKLAAKISADYASEGIFAIFSQNFVHRIGERLSGLNFYIYVSLGLSLVLAFAILFLCFLMAAQERRKEVGTLYILGARRAHITRIFSQEALSLALWGSLAGLLPGGLAALLLLPALSRQQALPDSQISLVWALALALAVVLLSLILALLAARLAVRKLLKSSPQELLH